MRVLVLAYHRVYPGYHIDPETFDYQMRVLKENFVPLSLDEVVGFAKGEVRLKRDGVAITFDDGWTDNFVYAYPILKKYGLRGAIFVSTKFISDKQQVRPTLEDYWNGRFAYGDLFSAKEMDKAVAEFATQGHSEDFLTWDEIRLMRPVIQVESHGDSHAYHFRSPYILSFCGPELKDRENWLLLSGIRLEIGAPIYQSGSALAWPRYYEDECLRQQLVEFVKTCGSQFLFSESKWKRGLLERVELLHRNNANKSRTESLDDYCERVRVELETSALNIMMHVGSRPRHLAWPFGEYNAATIDVAKGVGFQACYTSYQGSVKRGANCYELPRFSPPRNRVMFLSALQGSVGMACYRCSIAALSLLQKLNQVA